MPAPYAYGTQVRLVWPCIIVVSLLHEGEELAQVLSGLRKEVISLGKRRHPPEHRGVQLVSNAHKATELMGFYGPCQQLERPVFPYFAAAVEVVVDYNPGYSLVLRPQSGY
jgi:hypothetical protein